MCSRCRGARFCSPECQRASWPAHRPGCRQAEAARAASWAPSSCSSASPAVPPTLVSARLIVGMTSLPSRLGAIGAALRSIAAQGLRPDRLVLSLPRNSARTGQEYSFQGAADLQRVLEEHRWVEVQWLDTDFGPGTKLLGALHWLQRNGGCRGDDLLMILDDDHCYLPHALEELAQEQLARGTRSSCSFFAYFFRGLMVPQGADIIAFTPGAQHVELVREFFDAFVDGDGACFLVDDLWIGMYFFICDIQVVSLRDMVVKRGLEMVYTRAESASVDALERLSGDDRRDRVMVRAFDGLVARLVAAGSEGLKRFGGAAAHERARRLQDGARQADAQIAELEALLRWPRPGAMAGRAETAQRLSKLKHLFQLKSP